MDFEVNLLTVAIVTMNVLVWVCLLLSWIHSHRYRHSMQRQFAALRQQLVAVESGSFGVGKSLLKIEQKARSVADKSIDQPFVSYKEAANLLEEGAGAAYLVNKLAMSRSEADLVVLLHPHQTDGHESEIAATETASASS